MRSEQQAGPGYTYDQLHERACIVCGEPGDLVSAGHVTANGLCWAVAAHREHMAEAS